MTWITRNALVCLVGLVATNAWSQTQDTVTSFTYDNLGNVKTVSRPLGHSVSYGYDAFNRMTQQNVAVGSTTLTTQQDYDGLDQLSSVTDPRRLVTTYTVDGLGNQSQLSSPDTQRSSYTTDEAGNVLTATDARGKTTRFQYDALGRLLQAQYQSGTPSQFEYDGGLGGPSSEIGNLTRMTDESGSTTFTHDLKGRVLTKTQTVTAGGTNAQFTVQYAYGSTGPAVGKLESMTYPSGAKVTYQYDESGRVNGVTLKQSEGASEIALLTDITYTATGALQSWRWGNAGLPIYQRTYDLDGRMTSYPTDLFGTIRTVSYNAASLVTAYSHAGGPDSAQYDQIFGYDTADRLTSFTSGGVATTYTYDANGNRTQQTGPNVTYVYDAASNRLSSATFSTPRTYTYDAAGNRASDGLYTYTYSDRGRLAQVRGGTQLNMYYNAQGQRVLKATPAGNSYYVYDESGHTVGEYGPDNEASVENVYLEDLPIAFSTRQGYFYVLSDQINTAVIAAKPDGAIIWDWRNRDPFGNNSPRTSQDLPQYNLRFPGQVADVETNLYYNYFRDYDPQTGRYIESDPVGLDGGINTYGYVDENPLSASDPSGLSPGDRYKTPDLAAKQAIRDINPTSIRQDREYGGRICRIDKNSCTYTPPVKGTDHSIPQGPGYCPAGTTDAGEYHTHASDRPGYKSNVFSGNDQFRSDNQRLPSYLGTPNGDILKYTPNGKPFDGKAERIGNGAK